ncbi:MAG: hypothetical protein D6696_04905 [Acidobacteria bacterium]|nr:MAG: hypothetical protein D6696_04905 [Acidobacteriota bacterium]
MSSGPIELAAVAAAPAPPPPVDAGRPFDFGDLYGEVAAELAGDWDDATLEPELRRLIDPASALDTVHWGRNYLYRARLETAAGPLEVVVKQFRNHGWRERRRRRRGAGKARRSWLGARAFAAAGIPTAAPLALIESRRADGPSFFVSRYLAGALEARYLLRAANAGTFGEAFPEIDFEAFLEALGATLRRMHEAGLFHRDLSIGNVLLLPPPAAVAAPEIAIVDLNRSRRLRSLSAARRTRDLCRLAIFTRPHQRRFLRAYWGADGLTRRRWLLYLLYHHGFRFKIAAKKRLRGAVKRLWQALAPRRAHVHIPSAPAGARARDKSVWDPLSDQPHQHAGRLEKLLVRTADAPSHLRQLTTFAAATPRIWRRYRELCRELYRRPVAWDGMGVAVRPWPADPEALRRAIADLGCRNVLLRLHPWAERHDDEEALARTLAEEGYDLTFALPQNRELVRDPARWRAAVEELGERFAPYGRRFQVGQAVNRSKWGVWRYGEYLELLAAAAEILRRRPGVEILGPAVIDFELHVTAALVNLPGGVPLDALASLLYVDRRGAPENRQLGFDTVGKVVLCRAIADTARCCAPRSWITEVNWPLWEGPHSPAGRAVAVDEATQASYLARYYLLALSTGLVERVYWWQLVARGYGLVAPRDDGRLRRRPSYDAFATLARTLEGSRFVGRLAAPAGAFLYRFEHPRDGVIVVGWSRDGAIPASLPAPIESLVEQDGTPATSPQGDQIVLKPAIRYARIAR